MQPGYQADESQNESPDTDCHYRPCSPIAIGNLLILSPDFPPLHTVHESFPLIRRSIVYHYLPF